MNSGGKKLIQPFSTSILDKLFRELLANVFQHVIKTQDLLLLLDVKYEVKRFHKITFFTFFLDSIQLTPLLASDVVLVSWQNMEGKITAGLRHVQ